MRGLSIAVSTCILTFSVSAAAVCPQNDCWDRDYEGWLQLVTEFNLDTALPKLRASMDLQARYLNTPRPFGPDVGANMNPNIVFIVRPAIGYQLASWGTVWAGYAWQPNYFIRANDRVDISEHRIWEQFSANLPPIGPVAISSRTRIEERYRDKGGESQGEGLWAGRLRQQFRAAWTLVKKKPWQLIVWDEVFFHLNTTGVFAQNPDGTRRPVGYPTEAGFDQNRAFMGIGYQASPTLRVEMGYLNQIVYRMGRSPDQINHIFFMGAFFKFQ